MQTACLLFAKEGHDVQLKAQKKSKNLILSQGWSFIKIV